MSITTTVERAGLGWHWLVRNDYDSRFPLWAEGWNWTHRTATLAAFDAHLGLSERLLVLSLQATAREATKAIEELTT